MKTESITRLIESSCTGRIHPTPIVTYVTQCERWMPAADAAKAFYACQLSLRSVVRCLQGCTAPETRITDTVAI